MRYRAGTICVLFLAAGMLGCQASTPVAGTLAERLQSEDPAVRIQAAVEAGNARDKNVLPLLVDRLSDTDQDVRFFAGMALEKIVGAEVAQAIGWRFYDPPERRDQAIQRWRQWIREHTRPAASEPTTTQAS